MTTRSIVLQAINRDLFLELGVPQVRLDLSNFTKLLLRISGRDRRGNDHVVAHLPVDRGGDALLVARLQGVDHTQNLSGVAAGRSRVHHGQADFLARINDENRTNGESDALLANVVQVLLVNHVVEESHLAIGVGNDGKLHVSRGNFIDILDPLAVRTNVIGALKLGPC